MGETKRRLRKGERRDPPEGGGWRSVVYCSGTNNVEGWNKAYRGRRPPVLAEPGMAATRHKALVRRLPDGRLEGWYFDDEEQGARTRMYSSSQRVGGDVWRRLHHFDRPNTPDENPTLAALWALAMEKR